jgi:hypothetical protein
MCKGFYPLFLLSDDDRPIFQSKPSRKIKDPVTDTDPLYAATSQRTNEARNAIIGESFKDLRAGDRFWNENLSQPTSFTLGKF